MGTTMPFTPEYKHMPLLPRRAQYLALPAILALALGGATANAGIPNLEVFWSVNAGPMHSPFVTATDNLNGTFSYIGADTDLFTAAAMTFSVLGNPDLSNPALLSGGITLSNPSAQPVDIFLRIMFPIDLAAPAGTQLGGSATVGMTSDIGGGRIETLPGAGIPLWQALIDGNPVGPLASMYHDQFFIEHTGSASSAVPANFGLPGLDVPAPGAITSIGIEFNFRLSAFDSMSLTGPFAAIGDVIPSPGSLALLAVAGLVVGKRRRRQ